VKNEISAEPKAKEAEINKPVQKTVQEVKKPPI